MTLAHNFFHFSSSRNLYSYCISIAVIGTYVVVLALNAEPFALCDNVYIVAEGKSELYYLLLGKITLKKMETLGKHSLHEAVSVLFICFTDACMYYMYRRADKNKIPIDPYSSQLNSTHLFQ